MTTPNPHPVRKAKQSIHELTPKPNEREMGECLAELSNSVASANAEVHKPLEISIPTSVGMTPRDYCSRLKNYEIMIEKPEAQPALSITLPPEVASFIQPKDDQVKVDNCPFGIESLMGQPRKFLSV
jgi:hypothetical protein